MNLPLHHYLLDLAGGELSRLAQTTIDVDDARLTENQRVRGFRKKKTEVSSSSSSSSPSSCFISLHSRPSLTSGGSVSRWDSTVEKVNAPYMSPPRRPKRFSLDLILAENNKNAERNSCSLSPSSHKKDGNPVLPKRLSLGSMPMLDHDDHDSSSASTVNSRLDLHEILGNALEQCVDLDEYYEDSSECSISDHNDSATAVTL
jgi:hypothetical protein